MKVANAATLRVKSLVAVFAGAVIFAEYCFSAVFGTFIFSLSDL